MKKIFLLLLATMLMIIVNSSIVPEKIASAQSGTIIRIGSKGFAENRTLAWIIYHVLTDAGYRVFFQVNDASTTTLRAMLVSGEIDIYVEYTGTGVYHLNDAYGDERFPLSVGYDADLAFEKLVQFDLANNDLMWLPPAPGSNSYTLVVNEAFAEAHNVYTIEAFANYITAGNPVFFSSGFEFCDRKDGLQVFEIAYGFTLTHEQRECVTGYYPSDTLPRLQSGVNGTNVAMSFGTAAEVLLGEFVTLEDNFRAAFVYQPAPVIRRELLTRFPEILEILQPVFAQLDARALQDLNLAVAEFSDPSSTAAFNFLQDNDFISTAGDSQLVVICHVERPQDGPSANLRNLPSLDGDIIGNFSSGLTLPVDGRATDVEGFIWWRVPVRNGAWVREDTVNESGDCDQVPVVQ